MNKFVGLIARVLFVFPVVGIGLGHFTSAQQMAVMVPGWVPGGIVWVYITGACLLAAAIGILTGKHGSLAALLVALLILTFAATIHLPGMSNPDGMMKMMSAVSFLKDMGLVGGALAISVLLSKGKKA